MSQNYDHSKAYEPDGPIGEHLDPMMNIAEEHKCPVLFAAAVKSDDKAVKFVMRVSDRDGYMPDQMLAAIEILKMDYEEVVILRYIMNKFAEASKIEEAIEETAAMLRNEIKEARESAN